MTAHNPLFDHVQSVARAAEQISSITALLIERTVSLLVGQKGMNMPFVVVRGGIISGSVNAPWIALTRGDFLELSGVGRLPQ